MQYWEIAMLQDKLLVDSDAFFSLLVKSDANHHRASLLNKKLVTQGQQFITVNLVVFETATVLSRKINQQAACLFLENITSGKMEIFRIDEAIEKRAGEIFKKQHSKNTSFVDCTNMAVMEKLNLPMIFSFDRIYKRNGFKRIGLD